MFTLLCPFWSNEIVLAITFYSLSQIGAIKSKIGFTRSHQISIFWLSIKYCKVTYKPVQKNI